MEQNQKQTEKPAAAEAPAPSPPVPKLTPKQKFFYSTGCLFELTKWMAVLIVLGVLVHFFVGTIYIVDGQSMEPNFFSGQSIIVNRWQYNFGSPRRGEVVVLKFPGDPEHKKYIKRIIGLPGEKIAIKDNQIFINDRLLKETYLPQGTQTIPNLSRVLGTSDYFLLGDNRTNSSDSRIWGTCPERDLIGKAWYTFWPASLWGLVPEISY